MAFNKFISEIVNSIINTIFPVECLGCGKEGEWLCKKCFKTIPINSELYCLECKTKTKYGEFCGKCKVRYNLDGVFIASDYDNELLQKLIKTLKYKFIYDISGGLGRLLFLFIDEQIKKSQRESWLGGEEKNKSAPKILRDFQNVLIMPVPLHKKRKRWRGFNQAEEIGKSFIQYYSCKLLDLSLQRIRHTRSQAKLNEVERKKNLQGSFQWTGSDLGGRQVVLVDDVTTTGSTLEECAKVLKHNGAGEVWGLVTAKG